MGIMFRLFLVFAIFGGGFYTGVRFSEHQFVKDPAKLGRLVKKSVQENAKQQLDKAKQLLDK
jgi:hypothetical protein